MSGPLIFMHGVAAGIALATSAVAAGGLWGLRRRRAALAAAAAWRFGALR